MKKRKKKPCSREFILREEEIMRLKTACRTASEQLLVYGLLYTGMRVSEFLHLRRSWVHLERGKRGLIIIPLKQPCSCFECKAKRKGVWTPKTREGMRAIPVLDEWRFVLLAFLQKHEIVMEVVPHRQAAWRKLEAVGRRAGLKVFPHALRATFATLLAEKGFDAFLLSQLMGWSDIRPASEYVKLSATAIEKAFAEKW